MSNNNSDRSLRHFLTTSCRSRYSLPRAHRGVLSDHPNPARAFVPCFQRAKETMTNHSQSLCLSALCLPRRLARGIEVQYPAIVWVPRAVPHTPVILRSTASNYMQFPCPFAGHDWTRCALCDPFPSYVQMP